MRREQTPEDIGKAVVFFVSDDAKNITGQVLHVDGGQIMR
jgi:enoyl-[acyl-carrier-protein] reductase (NADH)